MSYLVTIERTAIGYRQTIRYDTLHEARNALLARFRGAGVSGLDAIRSLDVGTIRLTETKITVEEES